MIDHAQAKIELIGAAINAIKQMNVKAGKQLESHELAAFSLLRIAVRQYEETKQPKRPDEGDDFGATTMNNSHAADGAKTMTNRKMPVNLHRLFQTVFEYVSDPKKDAHRHEETQRRIAAMNALEDINTLVRRILSPTSLQMPREEAQERMARAMAYAYYQAFVVFSQIPRQEGLVESLVETGWRQWMDAAKHHLQMQPTEAVVESEKQAKAAREAYLLHTNALQRLIVLRDAEIAVLRDRIETLERK